MKFRVLLLLISISTILLPLASAVCVVETQGSPVYIGEYCDVSKVVSWKAQFAYFSNGYYSDTPTKIVDVSGFMYHYYIDPKKFVPGLWYKWDNEYESGGYNVAFEVRSGRRPNATVNATDNATVNATKKKPGEQAVVIPKDTDILIARGDYGILRYGLDKNVTGGPQQEAYIWLFGTAGTPTKILGERIWYSPEELGYTYEFLPNDTGYFTTGKYTGYYQFVGANKRADVFYDAVNNNLDSPYKNVSPVNLDPFIPDRIKKEFDTLENQSQYSDDILVPINMTVMEPDVVITDYWEDSDDIVIEGTTTMGDGTELIVELNPEHYALTKEIEANRHRINATGSTNNLRKFSVSIPIQWGEMSIGQHKLRVWINTYKVNVSMDKDFEISGIWVMPTPTPEFRKIVIVEGQGSHQVNASGGNVNSTGTATNFTVTNTPTPRPITPKPTTNPKNATNSTVTKTSTPKPTPIPEPTADIELPLNPAIAILAAVITGLMIIRRK